MARWKTGLAWVLQVLCGLMFVAIGIAKFGDPSWERKFERWEYPSGFYMVVGVVEAVAGVALFVPKAAFPSALTLMIVMVGAALTHLRFGETARLTGPLLYLAVLTVIAWLRRPSGVRQRAILTAPPAA